MQEQELYQKYSDGRHWEKHPTIYSESFVQFLKNTDFKGFLVDIGCGNGRDVNVFTKNGFNTVGIDNSKKQIEEDKKLFPSLKFEVQNVEKLSFEDNSVDAAFMINVIHYVNKEKAINEILRVLKPKGYLLVHFNVEITDINGKVDYSHSEKDILKLVSKFKILEKKKFERIDLEPVEHKHKILELILQKI